jgi:hypothetical protein
MPMNKQKLIGFPEAMSGNQAVFPAGGFLGVAS